MAMEESLLIDAFTENNTIFKINNSDEFIIKLFGPKRDSLYIVIPITIIYGIIFFTGLIGNISTCIVIAQNKSMHTATNYYLFSLAISDLLLLLSGLPQEVYWIWSRYPYVFGQVFCVLRGLFSETSANATVLTITAFTVERYIAICHPFLSHTMSKLSRAVKFILIIWLLAITFAIPQALQFEVIAIDGIPESKKCDVVKIIIPHSFEFSTIVFFIAPMSLITVLYALIGMRLKRSSKMKKVEFSRKSYSMHTKTVTTKLRQGQSSKRVIKMLVAVVVAFFVCWAPFHTQRLVAIYGTIPVDHEDRQKFFKIYEIVTYTSGVLYYFSTTVNPLLYNIMSNKFREAFRETFSRCCFAHMKSQHPKCTYSVLSRSALRGPDSCTDSSGREDASNQTNTTFTFETSQESGNLRKNNFKTSIRRPLESDKPLNYTTSVELCALDEIYKKNATIPKKRKVWSIFCKYKSNSKRQPITFKDLMRRSDLDKVDEGRCHSSSSCDISNSSLKDVDHVLLEYELNGYLAMTKSEN